MDTSSGHFSAIAFTDVTKKICACSGISIFLIVLFIISPLSNLFYTSSLMKIVTLIILGYTIYLNHQQTSLLRKANQHAQTPEIYNQLNINIICSYIFTLFLALLSFFIVKTFF